jgi:hypothetical protein
MRAWCPWRFFEFLEDDSRGEPRYRTVFST